MTKLKKLPNAYKPEKLKIHKFVIVGYGYRQHKYYYAVNLKEVNQWIKKNKSKMGAFEVFKATHTFSHGFYTV